MNFTPAQLLQRGGLPFYPCHTLLELGCADTGYYSGSDSLSPASSVESCSPFQWGMEQGATARLTVRGRQAAVQDKKKSRSKHPGKKRQSASEREKLRMRGLTKALHNLRTYLPPSVAPPGQTLTKIETLRLTIRYIAHLSAQLGLDEEVQHEGTKVDTSVCLSSPETQECCQYSFMPGHRGGPEGRPYCFEPHRLPHPNSKETSLQTGADMLMSATCFEDVQASQKTPGYYGNVTVHLDPTD
ncbi:mesogenin-1-like [Scleropages formosus]|uniref:mesogenin-1-like n=1 Tax=Scleropages formosus TaxID=113540 RepID=UPI0010FAB6CB|nr:mesogenin-1-like [Scleropages formosus]